MRVRERRERREREAGRIKCVECISVSQGGEKEKRMKGEVRV